MNKFGKKQINIVGHPGTGKTTKLGELVYDYAKDLDSVDCMLGANFSRSSAYALVQSLKKRGLNIGSFKYFRTIHSLAAKCLELREASQFVQSSDCREFFDAYGINYEGAKLTLDDIDIYGYVGDPISFELGNQLLGYFQYLKRVLITDEEIKKRIQQHWHSGRYKDLNKLSSSFLLTLYQNWEDFKAKRGIYDYDDMLQKIIVDEIPFIEEIEFSTVDEAQDLSPIQIEVLKIWLQDTDVVYVAFDPMQALYFFNGINPNLIADLANDEEMLLSTSYRVPAKPWHAAAEFARRNRCFSVDSVTPADREGDVVWISKEMVFEILRRNEKKKIFVLFRDNASVFKFADECLRYRVYHRGMGRVKSAFDDQFFIWQHNLVAKLIHELPLTFDEVRSLIIRIPAREYLRTGVKIDFQKRRGRFWQDSNKQSRFGEEDTHAKFYSLFRNCGGVSDLKEIISDPNVTLGKGKRGERKKEFLLSLTPASSPIKQINSYIGTYHAAKGNEADIVILHDYLLPNGTSMYEENCICFTGLTRTRDVDYIVPVSGYEGRGIMEKVLIGG